MIFEIGDKVILKEKKKIELIERGYGSRVNWEYVNQFKNKVMTVEAIHPNDTISLDESRAYWKTNWFNNVMDDFGIEELFEL